MAISKKSSNEGKGVAFEKRAKMDNVQQQILGAICVAAIVVGFALVGSVYLIRSIMYKTKVIGANDIVIDSYKQIQTGLDNINSQVMDMAKNEYLESIAGKRDSSKCANYASLPSLKVSDDSQLELYKTCSSLRAITDTMPSRLNTEAALASINQLMNWSANGNGVRFEGISASQGVEIASQGFQNAGSTNLHIMNSSVTLDDTSDNIKSALDVIENSVRSFDIVQAQLSFNDDSLKLSSIFASYYSDTASLVKTKRVVCADTDSDKCKAAGGDTAKLEEAYGADAVANGAVNTEGTN